MSQSTRALLEAVHAPLGRALKSLQFALMDRNLGQAQGALASLEAQLRRHMQAEEAILLPAYEKAVPTPPRGGAPSLFLAEHDKLRRLIKQLMQKLDAYPEAQPLTHDEALGLMEAVHPLKQVMHHHEMREEKILGPNLDEKLSEAVTGIHRAFLAALEG